MSRIAVVISVLAVSSDQARRPGPDIAPLSWLQQHRGKGQAEWVGSHQGALLSVQKWHRPAHVTPAELLTTNEPLLRPPPSGHGTTSKLMLRLVLAVAAAPPTPLQPASPAHLILS